MPRVRHNDKRRPWPAIEIAAFMAELYCVTGNAAPARILVEQIATNIITRSKIG